MVKKTLYIIDGYSFVFRAYHVQPPLVNPNGEPVGALYGITSMLLKIVSNLKPEYLCVALDSRGKNFRHDIYPQYKANRPETAEDLKLQLAKLPETIEALNIATIAKQGFEADDIIAYLSHKAEREGHKVVILSSDKDLIQLINDNIYMYDPIKDKIIDKIEVEKKYGISPFQMRDYLSLVGDTSDNIPGVRGIGAQTAKELLLKFTDLDGILNNLDKITQNKRRTSIDNSRDILKLSWDLVGLNDEIDINIHLDDLKYVYPKHHLLGKFLDQHGFQSLKKRASNIFDITFDKEEEKKFDSDKVIHKHIISKQDFEKLYQDILEVGLCSIYAYNLDDTKLCFSIAYDLNTIYCFESTLLPQGEIDLVNYYNAQDQAWCHKFIGKIIADKSILKIACDAKALLHNLSKLVTVESVYAVEDLMLMQFSYTSGKQLDFYNFVLKDYGYKIAICDIKISCLLLMLYQKLRSSLLKYKSLALYYTIDLPLMKILFYMEKEGIKIDRNYLSSLSKDFGQKIKKLSNQIYHLAGKEFNIASSQQLGQVLFEDLQFSSKKKLTKSSSYSTSIEILKTLSQEGHKIADLIIDWRKYSKLKNTYSDSLALSATHNDRVHTTFLQNSTVTGRLSSQNPNLQNIPVRSSQGHRIRRGFIAKPGYKLISADYSQIEIRLLSHIANITVLIDGFKDDKDIHSITASQIFKVDLDEVNDLMRRKAKAINFGIIYGISAFGLAKNVDISIEEAKQYIDEYFQQYPGIKQYMAAQIDFARQYGYTENIFGRKSFLPQINSSNYNLKSFSERAAINAPLQSSASDIVKKSMIEIDQVITRKNYKAQMLLQIHDELIFQSPISECDEFTKDVQTIMENIVQLSVAMKVDIKTGSNWQEVE